MRKRNKPDSIILLKTSKTAAIEKAEKNKKLKIERTCPCCGYKKNHSGMVQEQDNQPLRRVYICKNCGAEWLGLPIR